MARLTSSDCHSLSSGRDMCAHFTFPSSPCHSLQVYVLTSDDDTLVKFYTSLYHAFTPPTQFSEVRFFLVDGRGSKQVHQRHIGVKLGSPGSHRVKLGSPGSHRGQTRFTRVTLGQTRFTRVTQGSS